MKTIEVRDQVSLSLRRCFQLTVRGIRHRLFRSLVTVVIVTLAVSFLMMMLSTSFLDRQVARDVRQRSAGRQLLEDWLDKLTVPMTPQALAARLVIVEPGSSLWKEVKAWGHLTDGELIALKQISQQRQTYEKYLDGIKLGQRSALVGAREGDAVFEYLTEPANLDTFMKKIGTIGGFPTDKDALVAFLKRFSDAAPQRQKILTRHAEAVAGLGKELGARPAVELLASDQPETFALLRRHGFVPDPDVFEVLRKEAVLALDAKNIEDLLESKRMRGALARRTGVSVQELASGHLFKIASSIKGARWLREEVEAARKKTFTEIENLKKQLIQPVALSSERVVEVAAYGLGEAAPPSQAAGLKRDADQLLAVLRSGRMCDMIAKRLTATGTVIEAGEVKADPKHLFKVASTLDGARWMIDEAKVSREETLSKIRTEEGSLMEPLTLAPERIAEVAAGQLEIDRLAEIEASLPQETEGGWLGFSGRTGWLIIISFLVCAVGVTNAMLMSVTERFREIATMKCLGALDSVIMIMFVMESALQGLAGGLVGVVLGAILGIIRSLAGFGLLVFSNVPGVLLLASAGVCLVAGVVLAAIAAVYPAWVAARLAPMEAMRIE